LGESLLRQGSVKLWDLVEAKKGVGTAKRLGALLVERGALSPEQLIHAVTQQVRHILYSLFQWTEGHYRLAPGPTPAEKITLKISTPEVILEGIRQIESWSRIERGIGGIEARYVRADSYEQIVRQMTLSPEQLSLLTGLDETRSVRTICDGSSLPHFEVCRTLWAFRVIGVVRLLAAEPAAPRAQPATPPAAAAVPGASTKKRILAVALERAVFDKIDPLLSRAVFDVQRSAGGRAAAALCERSAFDLIVVRHPLADMAFDDFITAVRKPGSACVAAQLLVLTEAGGSSELKHPSLGDQSLTILVTQPRQLLEEVACRLLGVAPRTCTRLAVKLVMELKDGTRLVVHQTENISDCGMLLRTDTLYPNGTKLAFKFLLPGEPTPIEGKAEIVRHAVPDVEGVQGVGVRFVTVSGDGLAKLRDFIAIKKSAPSS
jgi:uncharacterized protein (TIGR02266 family)